jgi:hypothetical protein
LFAEAIDNAVMAVAPVPPNPEAAARPAGGWFPLIDLPAEVHALNSADFWQAARAEAEVAGHVVNVGDPIPSAYGDAVTRPLISELSFAHSSSYFLF